MVKDVISTLETRLLKMAPQIKTHPTREEGNKEAKWSRQFDISPDENQSEFLKKVFGIKCHDWGDKYNEAAGSENDADIITMHSSALLALLCFSNVSPAQPLVIDGIEYDEVHFEVKNRVFNRPSQVDVVLENSEIGDLLFLESKFTEYLSPKDPIFSKRYIEFYQNILPLIDGLPLQLVFPFIDDGKVCMKLQAASGSKLYMDGIKQCFSHLIGLCQGPNAKSNFKWNNRDRKIRFGTIVYNFPVEAFEAYKEFYSKTIGNVNADKLKASIDGSEGLKNHYTDRIEVLQNILTYQEVFKNFNLPEKVKTYYDL